MGFHNDILPKKRLGSFNFLAFLAFLAYLAEKCLVLLIFSEIIAIFLLKIGFFGIGMAVLIFLKNVFFVLTSGQSSLK